MLLCASVEFLSGQISIIATIDSEIILLSPGLKLFHFSVSFLEEHIIDSVLSNAIDKALEETALESLIIHFFPQ